MSDFANLQGKLEQQSQRRTDSTGLPHLKAGDVSANSKPDHPPGDSHVLTALGVGVSPNFLSRRIGDFELGKFSTVLKENWGGGGGGTSRFVSKKSESA